MVETKKNKAKKHSVATESKKEAAESSSVDSEQSSFNATGSSVCAKNISRTPNGKKVVIWTRLEMLCNIYLWQYAIFPVFVWLQVMQFQKYLSGLCAIQNLIGKTL